ncbi:hypothetical protein BJF78_30105 [Pseudonocardia sp. CNS-139]|nr:hypothetical protein BJF78_30105 [Pseudonocardia sp. CNS-139]
MVGVSERTTRQDVYVVGPTAEEAVDTQWWDSITEAEIVAADEREDGRANRVWAVPMVVHWDEISEVEA